MIRRALPLLVFGLALAAQASAQEISFNRDVRPILSAQCFACHGLDANKRQADLRLDVAEGALAERDGTFAIKPGDLTASTVWERINSTDPDTMMPPPATKKNLTAAEKEVIRRWIEQGAKYQKHWAFEPPAHHEPPAVSDAAWSTNPVDRFLRKRLEVEGLSPRPQADKSTLIRRVAFTLTGLPPTPAEVAQFEADTSPTAYESMVDRYLSSPRYGEEMARHWLDVARYADTHGLHLDNERTIWAYRDWVIRAFNENKPYDVFTVEQLAGDLLPNPTDDQLVATGFNRCNVTTSEGGSIEAEFVYRYAVDRTATMIQAWMGLTGGCAVCHDHKYDPLTMKEFYSLYAFFLSNADPAMDRNSAITDPFYKLLTAQQKQQLERLKIAEADAKRVLEEVAGRQTYTDPAERAGAETPLSKLLIDDVWLDDLFPMGASVKCTSRNPSVWSVAAEIEPLSGRRSLRQASAANYRDDIDNAVQPLVIPENPQLSIGLLIDRYEPSKAVQVELNTGGGKRRFVWGDGSLFSAGKGAKELMGELPRPGAWTRLEIPADKLDLKPGDTITGVSLSQNGGIAWWDSLRLTGDLDPAIDVRSSFSLWWKSRKGKDTSGVPGELATALKDGPDKKPSDELQGKLLKYYLAYVARPLSEEHAQTQIAWTSAQADRATLEDSIPGTFIFKDREEPREAFVMLRGQYDKPGDKVQPAVPAAFSPLAKEHSEGQATRLDLAKWLVSEQHPLTARVQVNRLWQQVFGTGIVKTSDDLGSQGEPPTHPELLDFLATWYREQGWDTKSFIRMLVTSQAFQQQSTVDAELLRRDPGNRLYARGPRFRLDAEQIRDNALFVSGLINLESGGKGVKGYQPPNIWEPVGYSDSNTRFYLQDHGPALYRRSVYTFLKRTAPPPFMSNFDAPNREQLCARRERTNTPLQALQLMNDIQHFEAARAFAERILTEGGTSPEERIRFAYRTTLCRDPQSEELHVLLGALNRFHERYQNDPAAARRVAAAGESPRRTSLPATDVAAYTLVANLILNLDETLNRN